MRRENNEKEGRKEGGWVSPSSRFKITSSNPPPSSTRPSILFPHRPSFPPSPPRLPWVPLEEMGKASSLPVLGVVMFPPGDSLRNRVNPNQTKLNITKHNTTQETYARTFAHKHSLVCNLRCEENRDKLRVHINGNTHTYTQKETSISNTNRLSLSHNLLKGHVKHLKYTITQCLW